jgi:adenine phosphoribosyltransferase
MDREAVATRVRRALRAIPDHPKPGIIFQDITPVLHDPRLFADAVAALAEPFGAQGVSHVVGIEARGFMFGAPVALALNAGFIPLRKPGKLPWDSVRESYALEYGEDSLEAHQDACGPGDVVLVVDDVLATGGTAAAAGKLVRGLGATLAGWSFLLAIGGLNGGARLPGAPTSVLLSV